MIALIVGARPNLVKAAPLAAELSKRGLPFEIIHTGQHYDARMSEDQIGALSLPIPAVNLGVGSHDYATQVAIIIDRLKAYCATKSFSTMVVFGDVNSTVAAALTARKLGLRLAHVEAGCRSHTPMLEEYNRVITDHLSNILFAPNQEAAENLLAERVTGKVCVSGNIIADIFLNTVGRKPELATPVLDAPFAYVTIHRAGNVDDKARFGRIVAAILKVNTILPVLWPVHPRAERAIKDGGFNLGNVCLCPPVVYDESVWALTHAAIVITDSGGLQVEAALAQTPCVTVRPTTEWVDTVKSGWNRLSEPEELEATVRYALGAGKPEPLPDRGGAAARIADELEHYSEVGCAQENL